MIRVFETADGVLRETDPAALAQGAAVVWIDLQSPERAQEEAIETLLRVDLPTRDDIRAFEHSSRFYTENSAEFMTATMPAQTSGDDPDLQPVTFVLTESALVTIRYHDPRAFGVIAARARSGLHSCGGAKDVLIDLLEATVDRIAEVLEREGSEIEGLSRETFRPEDAKGGRRPDYRGMLTRVGRKGDLVAKMQDSLASLDRMVGYLTAVLHARGASGKVRARSRILARDIRSILEHCETLTRKVTLLTDAVLGLIAIEQNATIKIFSVVAVVFMPPTLVASIYGMNFDVMPELGWALGYPLALALMVVAGFLPYLYFKRRGWL